MPRKWTNKRLDLQVITIINFLKNNIKNTKLFSLDGVNSNNLYNLNYIKEESDEYIDGQNNKKHIETLKNSSN